MDNIENKKTKKEKLLNAHQVCLELKVNHRNYRVIEQKYGGQELSIKVWREILNEDNLL